MRKITLAIGYGVVAGAVAALVLWVMQVLSALIWAGDAAWWRIIVTVMAGGALIAALRHRHDGDSLAIQLENARGLEHIRFRETIFLAIMATIAVAFGGAVGPEAGIIAVISEMAALVSLKLARDADERRFIGEVGTAAALGGLYGSPPGGAAMAQEHPEAPKWQLYLAAFAGLAGFWFATKLVLHGEGIRLHLPPRQAAGDGTDMLWAILPALLGAAIGVVFVKLLPWIQLVLARIGGPVTQTLVGTACFAVLAAIFPILLFSGHGELEVIAYWGDGVTMAGLLPLALLKILALTLCLAAGWRGGAIFPLLFAGAAAGGSLLSLLPQMPATVALVGAMSAAMTVGMGKPIAAALIALLLIGPASVGALATGVMVGWLASRRWPAKELH